MLSEIGLQVMESSEPPRERRNTDQLTDPADAPRQRPSGASWGYPQARYLIVGIGLASLSELDGVLGHLYRWALPTEG